MASNTKKQTTGPVSILGQRPMGQAPLTKQLQVQIEPGNVQLPVVKGKKKSSNPLSALMGGVVGGVRDIFRADQKKTTPSKSLGINPTPPANAFNPNATVADVLLGRMDVSSINTSDDNEWWQNLQASNPFLAKAIVQKQNMDYEKLVKQAQMEQSGVGNAVIDPMAVQLLFQNSINPFLSQVVQGANDQTANYGALMKQMTSDPNLPAPYRNTLRAQAPQQVANMNQLTTALAGYTATQPSIQSLLHLLNSDYQAQQENIALQRLGQQQALTGQLFGLNQ